MKGSIEVKKVGETKIGQTLVERNFEVKGPSGSINVKQMHYLGWPDHYTPTDESLGDFQQCLFSLIEYLLNSNQDEKAIVHCSAGIGRTGTTIALANILLTIGAQAKPGAKVDPQFTVFGTVRRLREQRFLMVQMEDQYLFIYQFLLNWLASDEYMALHEEEGASTTKTKKKKCNIF